MIASLMMYKRPELEKAHDQFWALIRAHLAEAGIESPETLSQNEEEFAVWKHPELVLSQTCGMPYRTWLHSDVALVGTPDYGIQGCSPGYYRSALIVRMADSKRSLSEYKNAVFAYNSVFSQSGYAAPYWQARSMGFWFENKLHTYQHLNSARAVSEGRADLASIDAVSWRLMQQHELFTRNLHVLEWTEPTPGLPLITADFPNADRIYNAVSHAISDLPENVRNSLGLRGIVRIPESAYLAINNPYLPECQA